MPKKIINTKVDTTETTAAGTYIKTTKEAAQKQKVTKDKRVQLVVGADEWTRFQAFAHALGTNTNAAIGKYIETVTTAYAKEINAYLKRRDELREQLSQGEKEQK